MDATGGSWVGVWAVPLGWWALTRAVSWANVWAGHLAGVWVGGWVDVWADGRAEQ